MIKEKSKLDNFCDSNPVLMALVGLISFYAYIIGLASFIKYLG